MKIYKAINTWHIVCMLAVIIMITVGGLTRLTESGLSITEWQLFDGILPPTSPAEWQVYFDKYKQIPEYKYINKGMSLDEFKNIFWLEYLHRVLGRITGLIFLLPFLYLYFKDGNLNKKYAHTKKLMGRATLLVILQGFAGWFMVKSGLTERTDVSQYRLALHLLLAFGVLLIVSLSYYRIKYPLSGYINSDEKYAAKLIGLIMIMVGVGAFVAGTDAGKIYNTFPMMGESFFPEGLMAMSNPLINFVENPVTIQFTHRIIAYITVIYVLYLFHIYKDDADYKYITRSITQLTMLQAILGILTLLTAVDIKLAILHQVNAAFLLIACAKFYSITAHCRR